jgi:hypothetical protein
VSFTTKQSPHNVGIAPGFALAMTCNNEEYHG